MLRGLKLAHLQLADHPSDAIGAAVREAGRITRGGPQHHLSGRRVGLFRWTWEVSDRAVSPHKRLAHGRACTERGMLRRRHRAYLRVLNGGAR